MSKIIKGQVSVDRSVYTEFSKDMGFFSIHADVWSVVSEINDGNKGDTLTYSHDITEICERFRINGKKCKRDGFEELYVKLYGEGTFAKLKLEFEDEVEAEYYATTEYTPYIKRGRWSQLTDNINEQ
tara:strand:- start:2094 stop:2474 length:381 start_codon:yes stop_codon:yes gene_type:complete